MRSVAPRQPAQYRGDTEKQRIRHNPISPMFGNPAIAGRAERRFQSLGIEAKLAGKPPTRPAWPLKSPTPARRETASIVSIA
ncbi:hypothetical protein HC024_15520 [Methylococcaceae bacterium WWC4]|nr:hypothetical protein [Methylococcaceae bacterium WWC4]